MKNIGIFLLSILSIASAFICIKLMLDAAMPEYTVLYKIDHNGEKIRLGVHDNITEEVMDATPENLKLSKGDITYVSPSCDVYNRKLICN
jgi:predicted RNase H-like nuclease (RuvC/YqgF family)